MNAITLIFLKFSNKSCGEVYSFFLEFHVLLHTIPLSSFWCVHSTNACLWGEKICLDSLRFLCHRVKIIFNFLIQQDVHVLFFQKVHTLHILKRTYKI